MGHTLYVRRPDNILRVLWSNHSKAISGQLRCRLQQERTERRLPVLAVSAQIPKAPLLRHRRGHVCLGVHGTEERPRHGRAELCLDAAKGRSAGKGKIAVELTNEAGIDILRCCILKQRKSDGGIDIVESGLAFCYSGDPTTNANAF